MARKAAPAELPEVPVRGRKTTASRATPKVVPKTEPDLLILASKASGKKAHSEFAVDRLTGVEKSFKEKLSPQEKKGIAGRIVQPPYDLAGLALLVKSNTWNYACINAKVNNLLGSGWHLVATKEHTDEVDKLTEEKDALEDKTEKGEELLPEEKKRLKEVTRILDGYAGIEAEIKSLFEDPNPEMEMWEISQNAFIDREGIGQGFIEVAVNGLTGKPDHLFHVPAKTMYALDKKGPPGWAQFGTEETEEIQTRFFKLWGDWGIYDRDTGELYGRFVTNEKGELVRSGEMVQLEWLDSKKTLPLEKWANAVLPFKRYDPSSIFYGLPNGIPALPAMAGKQAADNYNWAEFDNLGMAHWAVLVEGATLGEEAEKVIETFFEEDLAQNPHGVLLLKLPPQKRNPMTGEPTGDKPVITFKPLDAGPHEGHFGEYRKDLRDEVLAAHNVPPHLVSIIESGNIGGGQGTAQMQNFVKSVIMPMKTLNEGRINRIIKQGFGVSWLTFTFNTSDLTAELDVSKIAQAYSQIHAMTINEARVKAGLEPVEGGDRLFIMIPGIGMVFVDELEELSSLLAPGQTPTEGTPEETPPEEVPEEEPTEEPEGEEPQEQQGQPLRLLESIVRQAAQEVGNAALLKVPPLVKKRRIKK